MSPARYLFRSRAPPLISKAVSPWSSLCGWSDPFVRPIEFRKKADMIYKIMRHGREAPKCMGLDQPLALSRNRVAQRGNSLLEMALVITPLMALLLAIVEVSLPIFKKSTFTAAVREGCRYGITYQTTYNGTTYSSQTLAIKAVVQNNAMSFLAGSAGLNEIYVKYYLPVSPFTETTGTPAANRDGNVLEVSVQGYPHSWIAPIAWFYGPTTFQVTGTPLTIVASSADRLETLPIGSVRPSP